MAYVPQRFLLIGIFQRCIRCGVEMGLYGKLGGYAVPNSQNKNKSKRMFSEGRVRRLCRQTDWTVIWGSTTKSVCMQKPLAQDPQIYLMDEPLNGVDATTEETILTILENIRKEGKPL